MRPLPDATIRHLRRIADWPDLSGTRYEIVDRIGRGGMGTVYRARDRELEREVALKVLRGDGLDEQACGRLRREARILARLEHPGIVPVHDLGLLPDGRVYYVMKLVRGTGLDQAASGAPLTSRLRHFLRICEAVSFAHAHGIIHRDLKPTNIMLGPFGEVLVLDWGIAKLIRAPDPSAMAGTRATPGNGKEWETGDGVVVGTPGFMAPEQAAGQAELIDQRADVYALGGILRWLSTDLPRPVAAVAAKALARAPADRYSTVEELAEDVARFLDARPVAAYREPVWERGRRVLVKYQTPILLVLAYLAMRILFLLTRGR